MPHKHKADRNAAQRALYSDPLRREFRRVYMRDWNKKNPGRANLTRMLRKRGITLEQYRAKVESQQGACAICGNQDRLVVDHDHKTGAFRGLLCNPCNKALGFLRDSHTNVVKAAAYLSQGA